MIPLKQRPKRKAKIERLIASVSKDRNWTMLYNVLDHCTLQLFYRFDTEKIGIWFGRKMANWLTHRAGFKVYVQIRSKEFPDLEDDESGEYRSRWETVGPNLKPMAVTWREMEGVQRK